MATSREQSECTRGASGSRHCACGTSSESKGWANQMGGRERQDWATCTSLSCPKRAPLLRCLVATTMWNVSPEWPGSASFFPFLRKAGTMYFYVKISWFKNVAKYFQKFKIVHRPNQSIGQFWLPVRNLSFKSCFSTMLYTDYKFIGATEALKIPLERTGSSNLKQNINSNIRGKKSNKVLISS